MAIDLDNRFRRIRMTRTTLICFATAVVALAPATPVSAANIDGGPGPDTLTGTTGIDTIRGYEGNDFVVGLDMQDKLLGGEGDDALWGDAWPPSASVQTAGDDTLRGSEGNDGLYGGPGDDWLHGGPQRDWMFGNEGNDEFRTAWDSGAIDTISCGAGFDTVNADVNDRFMNPWGGLTDPASAGCEQVTYAP
jgi:Ca2+-binding RTX toxin-like protein